MVGQNEKRSARAKMRTADPAGPVLARGSENLYSLSIMVLPLDLLEGFQGNIYEMTCAAMKRSIQINLAGDEELDANRGKIVSTALKQILTQKVRYRQPEA